MIRPSRDSLRPVLGLLRELSRRRVTRVIVAYLVGSWLLTQVFSVLLPAMGYAPTDLRVVLILLALGLPVTCWLAWYFDITPEGLRLSEDEPGGGPSVQQLMAVPVAPAAEDSLAVMAFADRSKEQDQAFLAHGISEELINILGRVAELKIAPRTSAFAFAGQRLDVREIGRRLNVATVLDGSVRKSGDRLRISVELIDVAKGYCRWMNVYDRPVEDVFHLQQDIAERIVGELKPTLLGELMPKVEVLPLTHNTGAYDCYLKGRYYWNSRYAVGLERSIEYFNRAAALDPGYALPLSGLADAYSLLAYYNFLPPRDGFAMAGHYAHRAHALAPDLAETNASLAFVQYFGEWDFAAAEASFRRSLGANGAYGPARFWFAFLMLSRGRTTEALAQIEAARAAEPFSAIINGGASYLDFLLRRHDTGIQIANDVLRADPNYGPAHMFLGFHYQLCGRTEEAVQEWRKAVERQDRLLIAHMMLAAVEAIAGQDALARSALQRIDAESKTYVSSYFRAVTMLALGERHAALDCLERALDERNGFLVTAGADPLLDELHGEPRFLAILEKVGVPLLPIESAHQRTG